MVPTVCHGNSFMQAGELDLVSSVPALWRGPAVGLWWQLVG
jgi:hypothetical protein